MSGYKPPFHMIDKMVTLLVDISEQVGRITVLQDGKISPIFGERTESGPFKYELIFIIAQRKTPHITLMFLCYGQNGIQW